MSTEDSGAVSMLAAAGKSEKSKEKKGLVLPLDRKDNAAASQPPEYRLKSDKPSGPQKEAETDEEYDEVVQRLTDWLNENELMDDLEASLDKALSYKIATFRHLEINSAKTFLDFCNKLLRWIPTEDTSGKDVYHHIVCFYFVFNQPPLSKKQTAIRPKNYGKMSWLSKWLVDYAIEVGKFQDTPESLTAESLRSFYKSPVYKMDNYIVPRGGWKTFNQFFARDFKPGYRTIYGLNDDSVITSPADCTYGGQWDITPTSTVTIKHLNWSINELLYGSEYAQEFAGGIFTHSFLNTFDYHRLHTSVRGRVLESRVIQGQAYLETSVDTGNREGDEGNLVAYRSVNAPDSPGYQFVQMRGLVIIDSPIGLVAILPMGMAHVSSVILTAEEGAVLRKGEEIGYFQFGGSDIVTVFQKKSKVALTAVEGIHVSMGMQVATGKIQP